MTIAPIARRRRSRRTIRSALAMVDLVITMLIIGILSAAAAPKFIDALHRTRAESSAKRIKLDLAYARRSAISGSLATDVQFFPATDDYTIPSLKDLNRSGQAYAVELNTAPYNSTLVSATLGSDSEVIFDRFGVPDSGGVIIVESGGFQQTVTLDPDTGKATIP